MTRTTGRIIIVFCAAIALVGLNSFRSSTAQDEVGAPGIDSTATRLTKRVGNSGQIAGTVANKKEYFPELNSVESKIEAALSDLTDVNFIDTPLADAMQFLSTNHEIQIVVDRKALTADGIADDIAVNCALTSVSLRSTLKIILSPIGLTFETHNEVLLITAAAASRGHMINRVYPIGDLVADDDDSIGELVEAIQKTTDTLWQDVDGEGGTISVLSASSTISILQTYDGHQAILQLVRSIHQAKEASLLQAPLPVPDPVPPGATKR